MLPDEASTRPSARTVLVELKCRCWVESASVKRVRGPMEDRARAHADFVALVTTDHEHVTVGITDAPLACGL